MSSSPTTTHPTKRQKTDDTTINPTYSLIYWPSLPGRGEAIRLILEELNLPYNDTAFSPSGTKTVLSHIDSKNLGSGLNPPPLAPPILQHGELTISQLPNILLYLGKRHGLVGGESDKEEGEDENAIYKVNELVLTALDGFYNEAHDTHHPISPSSYYESQREAAKEKVQDYIANRLPKFLGYFERVLMSEASKGGEYLYGGGLTIADLVLWQGMDGVKHAFPKAMGRLEKQGGFRRVFDHYGRVKGRERISGYLGSERRQKYGMGVWRWYEELDE